MLRIVALAIDLIAAIAHGGDKTPRQAEPATRSFRPSCDHTALQNSNTKAACPLLPMP
jgi:hypothetical protein